MSRGSRGGGYVDGCLLGCSAVNSYQSTQSYNPEGSHLYDNNNSKKDGGFRLVFAGNFVLVLRFLTVVRYNV
jgi:hypothetical protein